MLNRLTDYKILVSGAGSGIGRGTVLRLLKEGATVVGIDVVPDALAETSELARVGGWKDQFQSLVVDISDEKAVQTQVAGAISGLGGLDALVNAAGILRAAHTHETTLELWNKILSVNLTGTFLMTRQALPALLVNGAGVVINLASTSVFFAHPYLAAYSASKGAIASFTHSLALEYASQGLRAINVVPGGISSGITDSTLDMLPPGADLTLFSKLRAALNGGKLGEPENVAALIAMLISEDGAFITGTEIRVDGGAHM